MNEHLGIEKIDANRLKDIGQECSYSRAYFINLTKLKYRFMQGEYSHDPYFFAKHGRDQKQEEYMDKMSSTKSKTHNHNAATGKEIEYSDTEKNNGNKSTASQMLQMLASFKSGPAGMSETLILDNERNKKRRTNEKGRGGDQIEM